MFLIYLLFQNNDILRRSLPVCIVIIVDFVHPCEYHEYIVKYNCVLCTTCSIE